MSDDRLVSADNVGKKFCRSLRRSLWYGVRDLGGELFGRNGRARSLRRDEFWALSGVSFELRRGETLGLIGHNGSGKTTLLRLLTGLIRLDAGRIEVAGRLQALIALGAGFNPLLTGRENVYINASILGFSPATIERLFDRIVEFAGLAEQIDMPLQSYSSGMVVRLGFSVAAHLEPDILLVDEVLSVGDAAFRTKCQVRIAEMKQNGVAIILVSHNLHTISHVCSRAITLDRGAIIFDGSTDQAIEAYRDALIARNALAAEGPRGGTGEIRVTGVEPLNGLGEAQAEWTTGEPLTLRLHYRATRRVERPVFNLAMHLANGQQVTGLRTDVDGLRVTVEPGEGCIDVHIPQFNLLPNIYTVDAVVLHADGVTLHDRFNHVATLKVRGGLDINGTSYLPHVWRIQSAAGRASGPVAVNGRRALSADAGERRGCRANA